MLPISGIEIAIILACLVGLGLYVYAWRATATRSALVKGLVRAGLPVLVLIPAAAAVLMPTLQQSRSSADRAQYKRFEYRRDNMAPSKPMPRKRAYVPRKVGQGASPTDIGRGNASPPSVSTGGGAPPELTSEEEIAGAAPPEALATEDVEVAAAEAEPPAAASPTPPSPKAQPSAPGTGAADIQTKDWDVVPVFYGTDRARADNAQRLAYGGGRGRRLELGHAMVSVPKSHQVPNIERPWALRVPYFNITIYEEDEDPKKHFVMQKLESVSRDAFLELVRKRLAGSETFKDQAFVFVHGFNTSFENGVFRTAQIAYDLKFDGAPFVYSWPSGGGVASYTYDRESSGQSTPYLKDFMKLVINETGAKAVSVIAHSMGNQPILRVLKDLKNATPDDVVISQVILAAPDVDRDNFENIAKEILGLAKGITLYVAANDQALQYSRRFHGGVPRAGDLPTQGPVVIDGIDTIDVTAASTDSLGINHSGYAENNALLDDIGRLIATGAAPENRSPPKFERVDHERGAYWRYPNIAPPPAPPAGQQ